MASHHGGSRNLGRVGDWRRRVVWKRYGSLCRACGSISLWIFPSLFERFLSNRSSSTPGAATARKGVVVPEVRPLQAALGVRLLPADRSCRRLRAGRMRIAAALGDRDFSFPKGSINPRPRRRACAAHPQRYAALVGRRTTPTRRRFRSRRNASAPRTPARPVKAQARQLRDIAAYHSRSEWSRLLVSGSEL
jgi:hypothetical protein